MADTVEPVPTSTTQKITFGELRETGVHHVLVYCRDHKCSHHVEVSADRWPCAVIGYRAELYLH